MVERTRRLSDTEAIIFIKSIVKQIAAFRNALGGKRSIYFSSVKKDLEKIFEPRGGANALWSRNFVRAYSNLCASRL